MRKYSSSFKTAFISGMGLQLKNDDCFAYVEMDKYACYVIADGITDRNDAESAREAIDSIITSFQASPGISKQALRRYMKAANKEFLNQKSYEQLKASVTIVITNYEKIRFAYAGNTRLRLFRDGRILHRTEDMSLSQELANKEAIRADMVAIHEERNNLFCYLGQEQFSPFISPKIKLKNADIIALYTRGIWENISEIDIEKFLKEAGNDPREECSKIEDILLDKQIKSMENYTFVLIYVDKIFVDPKRSKRIKMIITITLILVVLIIILCIVLYIFYKKKQENIETMNRYITQTEEYITDDNFVRAKEECEKAIEAADKVKDKESQDRMTQYLMFLEALLLAEESYTSGEYLEAEDLYLKARARSFYADNVCEVHIQSRLEQIERFRDVYDNIALGDKLLELNSFEMAEEKYIQAKKDAAFIYFDDGKKQALEALDKLYEKWEAAKEESEAAARKRVESEISAAEFVIQGDKAYEEGDFSGAKVFYLIAQERYIEVEDTIQIAKLNQKIMDLDEKKEEVKERSTDAAIFEEQARIHIENQEYDLAKEQYQVAKNIYLEIGKTSKADEVQTKIDVIDTKLNKQEKDEAKEKTVSGNDG